VENGTGATYRNIWYVNAVLDCVLKLTAMSLRMWLQPLQIVYAKSCFERIISFFYLGDSAMVQTLEVAAMERLKRLTNRSRAQLKRYAPLHMSYLM